MAIGRGGTALGPYGRWQAVMGGPRPARAEHRVCAQGHTRAVPVGRAVELPFTRFQHFVGRGGVAVARDAQCFGWFWVTNAASVAHLAVGAGHITPVELPRVVLRPLHARSAECREGRPQGAVLTAPRRPRQAHIPAQATATVTTHVDNQNAVDLHMSRTTASPSPTTGSAPASSCRCRRCPPRRHACVSAPMPVTAAVHARSNPGMPSEASPTTRTSG